jgi:hypothetical protein
MNRKKFVIHNPHALWFKENLSCFFAKTKSIKKYDFIFDNLYNSEEKVYVYLDGTFSSPLFNNVLKRINSPIIEFYSWVLLNKLNPFRFEIIKDLSSLSKNDVVFSFLYSSFIYNNQKLNNAELIYNLSCCDAIKVVHLSHYGYDIQLASELTYKAKIDFFISENNLKSNSLFFKRFFEWYLNDVITIPFVPQKRFKKYRSFDSRINKVLSTGTNTQRMTDNNFIDFFGSDILQPMRNVIIQNSNSLSGQIDSLINNLQVSLELENSNRNSRIFSSVKFLFVDFFRIYKLVYSYFQSGDIINIKNDSNYYKIDIVEKYNSYKMFIVPEEIIDLPGIGFIEGMMCGSVFIGLEDRMYTDIGLIPGIHYISYDGSLLDLEKKIDFYQNNPEELNLIAKVGYQFISEELNESKVFSSFKSKFL